MNITIADSIIGNGNPCFITFEPSSTYTTLDEAKMMIKESFDAGANGVKFQTFLTGEAERIMGRKDILVNFTTPTGKKQEKVFDALKRKELSKEEWIELVNFSHDLGITFITSVYFPETVDFVEKIGVDAIKVSKGDINNVLLIDKISKTNLPIILDAREKFSDVEKDIAICKKNNNDQIIIMHCPSGYPAEDSGIHLNAIKHIQENYSYPVGFADHSLGSIMNYAAVALGVSMLEVTITPDRTIEKVEHFMSLELNELKNFVKDIRSIESAMGSSDILFHSRVEESARRSLVSAREIKKGELITLENIDYRRPGDAGISVADGFEVLGKAALDNIAKNTFLQKHMIEQ